MTGRRCKLLINICRRKLISGNAKIKHFRLGKKSKLYNWDYKNNALTPSLLIEFENPIQFKREYENLESDVSMKMEKKNEENSTMSK